MKKNRLLFKAAVVATMAVAALVAPDKSQAMTIITAPSWCYLYDYPCAIGINDDQSCGTYCGDNFYNATCFYGGNPEEGFVSVLACTNQPK